ncbi:MAG: hypothetical protein FJZ16_00030 [Candidatus Omnitrophica bacterium]|nr:hypothetical protein [Candidatus Omnitrophota bacterium]
MKTIELKYIGIISVFKLFTGMFIIIGLTVGILSGMTKQIIPFKLPFIERIGSGVIGRLILVFLHGLTVGMLTAIIALSYNFFAWILGGIKFEIED